MGEWAKKNNMNYLSLAFPITLRTRPGSQSGLRESASSAAVATARRISSATLPIALVENWFVLCNSPKPAMSWT